MAFKYIISFALMISAASAVAIDAYNHNNYHGAQLSHYHEHDDHHAPAHYDFEYNVHDEHTGDIKSQKESRHEDKVEGFYTLVEPDGHRRIVHYTADKHSGFNAKVEREYLGDQYVRQHNTYNSHNSHNAHYAAPQVHKVIAVAPKVHHAQPAQTFTSFNSGHGGHYSSNNYHH